MPYLGNNKEIAKDERTYSKCHHKKKFKNEMPSSCTGGVDLTTTIPIPS
jgi:hypothetical protein